MSASSAFFSDSAAGIHPKILQALNCANAGYVAGYGDDPYTEHALALFRENFGSHIHAFPVLTGTAANIIALKSVTRSHQAVLCARSAHLQHHECGALEALLGSKLILVPDKQGKLTVEGIEASLAGRGVVHYVQPHVVSISQCTEWGTLYTLEEIAALAEFCHKNTLLLHMDGARLPNAAAALDCTLKEMVSDTGVDVLSFGGTKCGCMAAEAVVILRPELAIDTPYCRKQTMQLASKMRFISAQFCALLENDLWRELAAHANKMAQDLQQSLHEFEFVHIAYPVETNALFTQVPASWLASLKQYFSIVLWDEGKSILRWMTSFATQEADLQLLLKHFSSLNKSSR